MRCVLWALAAVLWIAAAAGAAPVVVADPFAADTEGRRSGLLRTGRLDEVERLCRRVQAAGQVCRTLGTSPERRPLRVWELSSVPAQERASSSTFRARPVVLVIAGIHAGEIDGKDALFSVVGELLGTPPTELAGLLDVVTLVVVPVYNVDGHERFGKNHRPNQRGPEQMGWRVTAQNLNLNRDWMKADAPETRLLLQALLAYDPVVTVDLHVTDGAQFQHDVAVIVEPWHDDGTDGPLLASAQQLSTTTQQQLTAMGHLPLDFYPSFERDDDPTSGFARGVTPARLTHGYMARRGRLAVLVETHSWQPYAHRVATTIDVLHSVLAQAKHHAPQWQRAARAGDALREQLAGKTIELAFDSNPSSTKTFPFRGYRYTRTMSEVSGALMTRYDERTPEVWNVPLVDDVVATARVVVPAQYAVLPAFAGPVRERLLAHGLAFTTTTTPQQVSGQVFHVDTATFGPGSYEGRHTVRVQGSWQQTTTTLPVGSLLVKTSQPRGRLVVELFEPAAPESLVGWGFFNARLEQKEYMEAYVAEDEARLLLRDPQVKAAFAERLKDPAFAASAEARLDFFYRRHPAWDDAAFVLPVVRVPAP
jgi:hypothetical protein